MQGKLIIICGLPGAGKSTRASGLELSLNALRLCADDWMRDLGYNIWDVEARERVEALQWKVAQRLLEMGQTVVIEWGTWGRSEREQLRDTARNLKATVELHYLTASHDTLFDRTAFRRAEDPPITREHMYEWASAFQAPTADEIALYDHFELIETS